MRFTPPLVLATFVMALLALPGAALAGRIARATPSVFPQSVNPWQSWGVTGHSIVRQPRPSVFPQPVDPWQFWGAQPHRHRFPHRLVAPSTVIVSSAIIVESTPMAYPVGSVDYADPPAFVGPPSTIATGPPTPSVIEYSTGWYQLRGDGITIPYTWVWVPKPPPPSRSQSQAPEPGPPPAPADVPFNPSASGSQDLAPAVPTTIYHWTDEHGVTTWTDRWDKIPERYRAIAQRG